MSNIEKPPLGFVLAFLLFSLIFFSNTFKLWFKTDIYYQELLDSLGRTPSIYPFKEFFLRRMENRKRWEMEQKFISMLGLLTVLGADVMVLYASITGN